MINHDTPHQLSGRRSRWVTSYRAHQASSPGLLYAANSNGQKIFTARPEAIKKNCGIGGGFEPGFPLTHMNRHNNQHAGETKTKP
jgi:hypothetical protein